MWTSTINCTVSKPCTRWSAWSTSMKRHAGWILCFSPNYFGDMLKKETGKTPQEYIQEKVIEVAKDRIVGTEETVSRIAYSLGFQYPQHLCRLFKKREGCTPNEYRAMMIS